MKDLIVNPVGEVVLKKEGTFIELKKEYIPAIKALDDFEYLNIIWWFSNFDYEEARSIIETEQPYKSAPASMGIFATRSPVRPNPIALTTVQVLNIDYESGIIEIAYIDAEDKSPVLDIKPYTPSVDRVENPKVPDWCSHWPKNVEESGDFDWGNEFNF